MSTTDDLRAIRDGISGYTGWHPFGRALLDVLIAERETVEQMERYAQDQRSEHVPERVDDPTHPSTAAEVAPGRPQDASGSGNDTRVVCEPHRGPQGLADDLREFAARADALEADRSTLAEVNHEAETTILVETMRAEKAEAERDEALAEVERMKAATTPLRIEPEPDSVSVDILPDPRPFQVAMLTTEMNAWRHKAIRRNIALARAERERDEAHAEVKALESRVNTVRHDRDAAEAAVARVRALLDRPLIPSALLRDALDDHQQHDERPVSGAGMGERE